MAALSFFGLDSHSTTRYSTLRTIEDSTRILGLSLLVGLVAVNFASAQTSVAPTRVRPRQTNVLWPGITPRAKS